MRYRRRNKQWKVPSTNFQVPGQDILEFEIWNLFGTWNLELENYQKEFI